MIKHESSQLETFKAFIFYNRKFACGWFSASDYDELTTGTSILAFFSHCSWRDFKNSALE